MQGVTADVILQPGTVISAQVQQILGNDQVQIAIGGQSIVVVSQVPLQAGQTLQLSVSQAPDGSIELAVVNPGLGAAAQTIADLASAGLTADLVALTPRRDRQSRRANHGGRGRCTQSAHATGSPRGNGRRPGRGDPADQSCAAVCRSQRGCRRERPATAGSAGRGASAGAAHQPRPGPDRRRHQAGVPEFRPVSGSLAGVGIGGAIRRAGSQGGADRAAPGADDLARRRGADAGHHDADDDGDNGASRALRSCRSEVRQRPLQVSSLPVDDHGRARHTDHHLAGAGAAARARDCRAGGLASRHGVAAVAGRIRIRRGERRHVVASDNRRRRRARRGQRCRPQPVAGSGAGGSARARWRGNVVKPRVRRGPDAVLAAGGDRGSRWRMSTTACLPAPTCRRRRSAGHCRRRSRCCRRRWYRIRRPRPPCSICSPTPMARSRGRRCCRWLRCPIRSTPVSGGSIRRRRAGILKFRL